MRQSKSTKKSLTSPLPAPEASLPAVAGKTPSLRLEWLSPSELAENPLNWRQHPPSQMSALADVIDDVGWAGACLFNERTGRLIDGHARKKVALEKGTDKVPVLVGNWSEEQERLILATLDPLAAMAGADAAKLDALLRDVQTGSGPLASMLTELAKDAGVLASPASVEPAPPDEFGSYDETIETVHQCPKCGYRFSGGGNVDQENGDG